MKNLLDLTKEEIDSLSDEEFNSICWQCNVTPAKVTKILCSQTY